MLEQIKRLLKTNGKLIISVPNYNSISMRLMKNDDYPRHLYMFTPKLFKQLLAKYNFICISEKYNNDINDGSCKELIVFIVKRLLGYSEDRILYEHHSVLRTNHTNSIFWKMIKIIDRLITIPLSKISELLKFNGTMNLVFEKK